MQLASKRNVLSDSAPQIISLQEEQADLTALLEQQIASTLGSGQQNLARTINVLSLGELKQAQLSEFAQLGLRKEGLEERLASLKSFLRYLPNQNKFISPTARTARRIRA